MNTSPNRVDQYPADQGEAWLDLVPLFELQTESDRTPFNYPKWLHACAKIRGGTVYKVFRENRLIGAAAFRPGTFTCKNKKIQGLVPLTFPNSDFFAPIVASADRKEFWKDLIIFLQTITPRSPVLFEHLRPEDSAIVSGICGPSLSSTANPIRNAGDASFVEVLKKKSLKRHRSAIENHGSFSVTHEILSENTDLKALATLHRERWNFEGHPSVLNDPQTLEVYYHLTAESDSPENAPYALLTTLTWNGEPIAIHLGYVWSQRFLYHLPTINIKYIDKWPGEVLMYELFAYAISNGIVSFDFGVGNETYKNRYATSILHYDTFVVNEETPHLRTQRFRDLYKSVWSITSPGRVYRYLSRRLKRKDSPSLLFYSGIVQTEQQTGYDLLELDFPAYVDYVRMSNKSPYGLTRGTFVRFRDGWRLFALKTDEKLVSFGWAFHGNRVYLSELNKTAEVQGSATWLLDFVTLESERGKGYYPSLLKKLVAHFDSETAILIYALKSNESSIKGIEKAGFRQFAIGHATQTVQEFKIKGSAATMSLI